MHDRLFSKQAMKEELDKVNQTLNKALDDYFNTNEEAMKKEIKETFLRETGNENISATVINRIIQKTKRDAQLAMINSFKENLKKIKESLPKSAPSAPSSK